MHKPLAIIEHCTLVSLSSLAANRKVQFQHNFPSAQWAIISFLRLWLCVGNWRISLRSPHFSNNYSTMTTSERLNWQIFKREKWFRNWPILNWDQSVLIRFIFAVIIFLPISLDICKLQPIKPSIISISNCHWLDSDLWARLLLEYFVLCRASARRRRLRNRCCSSGAKCKAVLTPAAGWPCGCIQTLRHRDGQNQNAPAKKPSERSALAHIASSCVFIVFSQLKTEFAAIKQK